MYVHATHTVMHCLICVSLRDVCGTVCHLNLECYLPARTPVVSQPKRGELTPRRDQTIASPEVVRFT